MLIFLNLGRALAAPFTAWLRVPLSWFHSQTLAFFPDETHRSIRRTFESPFEEGIHRNFCGYCGTQLSRWEGSNKSNGNFISLTLGSLFEEDLDKLQDLGVLDLPTGKEEGDDIAPAASAQLAAFGPAQGVTNRGAPWFESMVEESRLGRIKRQKGGHTTSDGSVQVEWEIVEWSEGGSDPGTPGKRKLGDVEGDDVEMQA